jgi:hypothetical protein
MCQALSPAYRWMFDVVCWTFKPWHSLSSVITPSPGVQRRHGQGGAMSDVADENFSLTVHVSTYPTRV